MQQSRNMVYSKNDSLLTVNTGGSVTQQVPYELSDYTYPRMLDTAYLGAAEESWDAQAVTLGSMPATTTPLVMMGQQPHHENTALNTLDSFSASPSSFVNNTQDFYWSSSPPATTCYQSPMPTDLPPTDISSQDQVQYPGWYHSSPISSSSSSPASYQELMTLDIPISPPYSSSNPPYSFSMIGNTSRKNHVSGTRPTRRHTVSTSYSNPRLIGLLDINHHQQMKMRKVMKPKAKQQRPRSLSQNEQSTFYHHSQSDLHLGPWSTPPSSSCDVSCCGSPLSAEFLLNEQRLDWMMDPVYSKTTTSSMNNTQLMSDPMYQISPSSSSAPSFSPPLPLSACSSFSPANYVANNAMIGPSFAYNGTDLVDDVDDRKVAHLQGNDDDEDDDDDDAPYICQWADCAQEFEKQPHLIAHVKTLHIGTGKSFYQCRWNDCQRGEKPFTKRHKMHNHLRTHTKERPYICLEEGCGKRFARPDSLSTHGKIHTNIRPYECQHENCDKAYYHLRSLRKHEKSHKV